MVLHTTKIDHKKFLALRILRNVGQIISCPRNSRPGYHYEDSCSWYVFMNFVFIKGQLHTNQNFAEKYVSIVAMVLIMNKIYVDSYLLVIF